MKPLLFGVAVATIAVDRRADNAGWRVHDGETPARTGMPAPTDNSGQSHSWQRQAGELAIPAEWIDRKLFDSVPELRCLTSMSIPRAAGSSVNDSPFRRTGRSCRHRQTRPQPTA